MAPRVRFEQRYPTPPPGYSWATEVKAEETQLSPTVEVIPTVRLHSTLVFEMPKPEDWDELPANVKFQRKREYLCQQWGEENFTFLEDDLHARKFSGRIVVNKDDYYTQFEAWNAESFDVQYHNTMDLLENGLKMNEEDFSNLRSKLGISDAELFCALTNELRELQSTSAELGPTLLDDHPRHALASPLIKGQAVRKTVNSVTETHSAPQTAGRGKKRSYSKIDDSMVERNSQTLKGQKRPRQPPQKGPRIPKARKASSKPVTQQRTPITPPYEPLVTRRRLCEAKAYGQGFQENQHKHADAEKVRFDKLGAQFTKLESAARACRVSDQDRDGLRQVLHCLSVSIKARYPNLSNISDHQRSITLHWYWTIYNEFMKTMSARDPLTQAAFEELDTLRAKGVLTRELEMLRTTEIRQHSYQKFYGKWEAITDQVAAAITNHYGHKFLDNHYGRNLNRLSYTSWAK